MGLSHHILSFSTGNARISESTIVVAPLTLWGQRRNRARIRSSHQDTPYFAEQCQEWLHFCRLVPIFGEWENGKEITRACVLRVGTISPSAGMDILTDKNQPGGQLKVKLIHEILLWYGIRFEMITNCLYLRLPMTPVAKKPPVHHLSYILSRRVHPCSRSPSTIRNSSR